MSFSASKSGRLTRDVLTWYFYLVGFLYRFPDCYSHMCTLAGKPHSTGAHTLVNNFIGKLTILPAIYYIYVANEKYLVKFF